MEDRDKQSPDVSKAAQAQQPQAERSQQPETSQAGSERQSDTMTGQRSYEQHGDGEASDIEGSSFIGTQGASDSSSELIEDDSDFARDGQGAPE